MKSLMDFPDRRSPVDICMLVGIPLQYVERWSLSSLIRDSAAEWQTLVNGVRIQLGEPRMEEWKDGRKQVSLEILPQSKLGYHQPLILCNLETWLCVCGEDRPSLALDVTYFSHYCEEKGRGVYPGAQCKKDSKYNSTGKAPW